MATTSVEVSAQAILSHAQDRIADLEVKVLEIDEALKHCEADQVSTLMTKRREMDDERGWLQSKLSQYETASDAERWNEMKDALNAAWTPLAQRRINATQRVDECVTALVEALEAVFAVHKEQRSLLIAAVPMDKLSHRNAPKVQPQIATLEFAEQQCRLYVATILRPMMPTGGRFAPSTLETDQNVLAFRDFVL